MVLSSRIVIRVVDLHKSFAAVVALDGVSFEAGVGKAVCLLGPNGAGKTTMLRILAGFWTADSGQVEVDGVGPAAARERVGYLPENVAIYPEMRVDEYLGFRAALRRVPRRERAGRLDEAARLAGLDRTDRRRIVGQLSKGFRQRVGLADALLHRPSVLILDEATDGLDPNQRREILATIAELARERTVLVSTHVLPEAQALGGDVVVLDHGRVIARGPVGELVGSRLVVIARGEVAAAVRAVPGVDEVTVETLPDGDLRLEVRASADVRVAVAAAVVTAGALVELRPSSLSETFARLTEARA